jgi:DNA-binding LytR/AlgR family response regulator
VQITKKVNTALLETTVEIEAKSQKELDKIVYALSVIDNGIGGRIDDMFYRVSFSEILFFESVDKKTFAYTADKVLEIDKRLYEVEMSMPFTFMRAGKAVIINLARIGCFKSDFSGRLIAKMQNGEKVVVSRLYVKELKKKLNGGIL